MTRAGAAPYAVGAALCSAYAIWGSLLPFDFRPVPLSAALDRLMAEWDPNPLRWSRADALANLALFFPIGLTCVAVLDHIHVRRWSVIALSYAAALSVAVEIGQASVSWRTPSAVDVILEIAGAALGISVWRRYQGTIDTQVARARDRWQRSSVSERTLVLYVATFAAAWLFPFDFTLRPHEIQDKYAHHRLILPFQASPDAATSTMRYLTALAAAPLGVAATALAGAGRPRRAARASAYVAGVLLMLSIAQVAVFSRTTDGTLVVTAACGAIAGVALTMCRSRGVQ
jgi:VanZ family protein